MSVVNWATMHVENATDATFDNFHFLNNVGAALGATSSSGSRVLGF